MVRKCKGRQKIEMMRMSKESNLLVTFSKRRSGLFKKASELSTLCGVDIAIIVFSPGKKVFSFGHPSVESVVDRFLARMWNSNNNSNNASGHQQQQLIEAHRNASVRELNMQLMEMSNQVEVEKKRGEGLTKMRKDSEEKCWWEAPVEGLRLEELEQLKAVMEELKNGVGKQIQKLQLLIIDSNPNHLFFTPNKGVSSPALSLSSTAAPHPYTAATAFGCGASAFF